MVVLFFSFLLLTLMTSQQPSSFDDNMIDRFESEFEQMNLNQRKEIVHKIGVLGVYFRIHRQLVPVAGGETGYQFAFPEPVPALDNKLSRVCKEGLAECISEIFSTIRSSQPWLYPTRAQGKPEMELRNRCYLTLIVAPASSLDYESTTEIVTPKPENTAVLKDVINDNLLSVEISATQILCFLTLRKNPAFEYLPFCRYQLHDNATSPISKKIWPGYLVQKSPRMIDEYNHKSYECAVQSFCPDPCCHGVHSASLLFSSKKCVLNKCMHRDRCRIEAAFNDDFNSMRTNKWNITCPCGKGLMYRADVEACVHIDLCNSFQRCPGEFVQLCQCGKYFPDHFCPMPRQYHIALGIVYNICVTGNGHISEPSFQSDLQICGPDKATKGRLSFYRNCTKETEKIRKRQFLPNWSHVATFDCINTIANPGYKCICQLGYVRNDLGQCTPVNMSSSKWHGFAYSEPHPQLASKLLLLQSLIIVVVIVE